MNKEKLRDLYLKALETPSDINAHISILKAYGDLSDIVVELGSRRGKSTTAWAYSEVSKVIVWDLHIKPEIRTLQNLVPEKFSVYEGDVLEATIPPCTLLFIDTLHTYLQLKQELTLHGNKAQKWIIFHDTTTFGDKDEVLTGHTKKGLWPAINEFMLHNPHWEIKKVYAHNNGLTILERKS